MKKIEATIQTNKVNAVRMQLMVLLVDLQLLEGNGRGSGKRQNIRSERGTNIPITAEYNKVAIISTIVDDSIVEKVSKVMKKKQYLQEKIAME